MNLTQKPVRTRKTLSEQIDYINRVVAPRVWAEHLELRKKYWTQADWQG